MKILLLLLLLFNDFAICVIRIDALRREICSSNVKSGSTLRSTSTTSLEIFAGQSVSIEQCITPVGSRKTSRFLFGLVLALSPSSSSSSTNVAELSSLADDCSYFERVQYALMRRFIEVGEEQQWHKSTLLVSQTLLDFIDRVPLRRVLLRRMFANIGTVVDVALIDSLSFITITTTTTTNNNNDNRLLNDNNDNNNNNNINFESFFDSVAKSEVQPIGRSAVDDKTPSIAYAGLSPGHQGKNLLAPICDPDACLAWSRKHVDALVRDASADIDVTTTTIEVIMLSDSKQRQWAERTEAINRRRAQRYGWRFTAYNHTLDNGRAVAWSKVVALQRHIERARRDNAAAADRHWVLWLDADSFVESDGAARIEALARLAHGAQRDVVMPADPPIWECQNLCTGIMLWRASAWSAQFLELWLRDGTTRWGGTFLHSFSWEQRIINALWHERAARFYVAPYCVLNQACSAPPRSGAAVVHCMGAEVHIRLARIAVAEQDRFEPPLRYRSHDAQLSSSSSSSGKDVIVIVSGAKESDFLQMSTIPTALQLRYDVRLLDQHTTFDNAVRAMSDARLVIGLDGSAPMLASLMRLLSRRSTPGSSLVIVDVQPSSTLSPSCRRTSQQARLSGVDYQRKMAPFDWNSIEKIMLHQR